MANKLRNNVQGREYLGGSVTAYLDLKYASLKSKFSRPVLYDKEQSDPKPTQYTTLGPASSGPDGGDREQNLIFQYITSRQSGEKNRRKSVLDFLTLSIARPSLAQNDQPHPVLAYVHGGGFKGGCQSRPQNELLNLVRHSINVGLPVIGVSINYRHGPIGFLSSAEMRSAGYLANNGLRDQRVALHWIQRHIRDFGGDPENVTLVGHSAGGVSATLHLSSDQPLFKRLVPMSGTLLSMRPVSLEEEQKTYELAMQLLGFDGLSKEDRLKALDEIDPSELAAKIPPFVTIPPVIDSDICVEPATYEGLSHGFSQKQHKGWCRDILLGDCQFDGSILSLGLNHRKKDIGNTFLSSLQRSLRDCSASECQAILQAYDIISDKDSSDMLDEMNYRHVLRFCQDIKLYGPVVTIGRSWTRGSAYLYHFNEGHPCDEAWKRYASHVTDLALVLLNFSENMEEPQKRVAEAFATDILLFAHGDAPWPSLDVTGSATTEVVMARVYGPVDKVGHTPLVMPETDAREGTIWGLCDRFGADELLGACEDFLAGH